MLDSINNGIKSTEWHEGREYITKLGGRNMPSPDGTAARWVIVLRNYD